MKPTDKIFLKPCPFICMVIAILPDGAFGIVGLSGYKLIKKSTFSVKIEGGRKELSIFAPLSLLNYQLYRKAKNSAHF